jgi:hypothetical protein
VRGDAGDLKVVAPPAYGRLSDHDGEAERRPAVAHGVEVIHRERERLERRRRTGGSPAARWWAHTRQRRPEDDAMVVGGGGRSSGRSSIRAAGGSPSCARGWRRTRESGRSSRAARPSAGWRVEAAPARSAGLGFRPEAGEEERDREREKRIGKRSRASAWWSYPPRGGRRGEHLLAGIDGGRAARQLSACVKEEDKGIFAQNPLPFAVFLKTIKNRAKTICTYCFGLFLKT